MVAKKLIVRRILRAAERVAKGKSPINRWNPVPHPLRDVPVDHLLLGKEGRTLASDYAYLTRDILRFSTPATQSPHLDLLRKHAAEGPSLFLPARFMETAYYRNAAECIAATGDYFGETGVEGIIRRARYFAENPSRPATSPIQVLSIADSDCYQIFDGYHRIARAIFNQQTSISVQPIGDPVHTPAQELLLRVKWQKGRPELYQPIDLPEVKTWTTVRRCADRFSMMQHFLQGKLARGSYIDLGCSYGWFVREMGKLGFDSSGIDSDRKTLNVGQKLYGIPEKRLDRGRLPKWAHKNSNRRYDVVSLFSVAHHFVRGWGGCTAEELVRSVDKITDQVLFFDTGEAHEGFFGGELAQWTPEFIQKWLKSNTTFSEVIPLGKDEDGAPPFATSYGRTLFACVR